MIIASLLKFIEKNDDEQHSNGEIVETVHEELNGSARREESDFAGDGVRLPLKKQFRQAPVITYQLEKTVDSL